MSLAFDATFYQAQRPDVFNAFVQTQGSTGLTWAAFAEQHYNTFGWLEGSDPSASFDTSFYLSNNVDVAAAGVNPFQHFLSFGSLEDRAPTSGFPTIANGQFVPATYAAANSDLAAAGITTDAALYQHFVLFGQFESRPGAPVVDTPSNGSTFTLTTGVDSIVGTSFNDTINGYIDAAGTTDTFTAADSIDGGDGTDAFYITVDGAAAGAMPGANISNVENFFIRETGGTAGVYDFGILSGESQVWSDRSTDAVTFSNLATGTTVGLMGNGTTVLGNVTFGMATTTNDVNVAIADGVGATGAAPTVTAVGTATTANFTSSGAANTVGTVDVATASLTTVNFTASANLVGDFLSQATDQVGANGVVNVSGAASSVRFTAALDDTIATIDASGLSAGGLTAILNTNTALAVTGGTGADNFTTGAALGTGSVNAGDGTDTLVVANTAHLNTSTLGAKYTNFETLQVNNGVSVDLDDISGITAIRIADGAGATGVTDLSAAQAAAITLVSGGAGAVTIGVKDATDVGQIDTVTIAVDDGATAVNTVALTAPVLTGVEKLVLNAASDAVNVSALTAAASLDSITLTATHASGTSTITSGAVTVNANTVVDASGSTAAVVIDYGGVTAGTNALAITGGSGNDTITSTGVTGDLVNGGDGIDSITITQDAVSVEVVTVRSTATASANSDLITGFESAEDKYDYNGTLSNGTGSAPGISAAEVASAANIAAALATGDAANDIVFIATTDLTGAQETALDAAVAGGMTAAEATAVEAALVGTGGALNGAIANLDTVLGTTDSVLFQFSTDTDTMVLRVTNTDQSGTNTLTADEIELVGVFAGTTDLVAADYI